jgi:hypothetical protein
MEDLDLEVGEGLDWKRARGFRGDGSGGFKCCGRGVCISDLVRGSFEGFDGGGGWLGCRWVGVSDYIR